MRALGIDPGTSILGFGVIEDQGNRIQLVDSGALRLGTHLVDIEQRLLRVHEGVEELIQRFQPGCVALEEAFYGRSAQSALRIGEARGVVIVAAMLAGIAVHQYPPATIKKAITGNGRADKSQVAAMVARILNLQEVLHPADASDAVAIALCHCSRRFRPGRMGA